MCGLRVCEILCQPFKSRVYIFYSPSVSPIRKSHPLVFKARCSRDLSSWCRTPGLVRLMWGLNHSLFARTSAVVIILPFVSCLPWGVGLDHTASPSFLLVSLWFLLYIFSCRKSFLLVVFIDSCSVNSCNFGVPVGGLDLRPSYSAILATTARLSFFLFGSFLISFSNIL